MMSLALMNVTGHKIQRFFGRKIPANGSMKSTKLNEHLTSVLPEDAPKKCCFFCAKKAQFEKALTLPKLGFAIS
jgi:hypothetical protein